MDLNELLAKRASTWEQMKDIMARAEGEKRELNADERSAFDKAEKDLEKYSGDIKRAQDFLAHKASLEVIEDGDSGKRSGDKGDKDEKRGGGDDAEAEYREAFEQYMRFGMDGVDHELRGALRGGFGQIDPKELRALGTTSNVAGGYTVPKEYRRQLMEAVASYDSVRPEVEVITTETGAELTWPKADDTANVGAILGENTQIPEHDLTFDADQIGSYTYTSKAVRVPLQLIQDGFVDFDTWLPDKLAERLGRIQAAHFTTGTGTNQPQGIVTGATSRVTAASQTAVTTDELVNLIFSVDRVYRARGAFMFNDEVTKSLWKLKDTTGRPIWAPSIQAGTPDTILGRRIVPNNQMGAPAAGVKSVLFGDFRSGYVIRDVRAIQQIRLTERYIDFLQVGFFAFLRSTGKVQNTAAYSALTQAAA